MSGKKIVLGLNYIRKQYNFHSGLFKHVKTFMKPAALLAFDYRNWKVNNSTCIIRMFIAPQSASSIKSAIQCLFQSNRAPNELLLSPKSAGEDKFLPIRQNRYPRL